MVMNARGEEALENAADAIRARHNVKVQTVAADITSLEGRDAVLAIAQTPDILITNAGGPPPGAWSGWGRDDFLAALEANMLTPIDLLKRLLPSMMSRGRGRVVNIT